MIPHRDEILRPAVSTDATAVPRYDLVRPDGTIIEKNVAMRLANPVAREGTPISKAALDEMLAASGVTAGTATAYTLAQEEYTLFDGAPVRFRLHMASEDGATLNINGTGAKPVRDIMGEPMAGGIPAGTWITAYYSAAAGAYVIAGGEAVRALYGERYTVDDAVAHSKDVPADALPVAEVGEIGGMTYKINVGTEAAPVYKLRSAAVTKVESVGVNLLSYNTTIEAQGLVFRIEKGKISVSGMATSEYGTIDSNAISIIKPLFGESCAFFAKGNNIQLNFWIYNASGTVVETIHGDGTVCTIPDTAVRASMFFDGATVGNTYTETFTAMLNKGTTALPYTPYFHDTIPITEAVRALDGYGWGISATIRNYVDLKKRKFVKRVGKVDLGTLYWVKTTNADGNTYYAIISDMQSAATDSDRTTGWLCEKYNASSVLSTSNLDDKSALRYVNNGTFFIRDDDFADATAFKDAMSGVMLYYELATPIITDISDILPAGNLLRVQPGGTITPINEYGYAVPTKITYQNNVLANRASIFALEKLRLAMELLAKADLSNASGTFGGVVKANAAAVSALGTAQVRNVTISAVDLTAGSSALATGDSYRVYS